MDIEVAGGFGGRGWGYKGLAFPDLDGPADFERGNGERFEGTGFAPLSGFSDHSTWYGLKSATPVKADMSSEFYTTAVAAAANEEVSETLKGELKDFVKRLVGYPCKIACVMNGDSVDIIVFSEEKKAETDWLEMQESGAVGVLFYKYPDENADAVERLDIVCERFNESHGLIFEESDSEEEEEEEEIEELE
jgi:hypothetical protein